jgi:hypothetical protein
MGCGRAQRRRAPGHHPVAWPADTTGGGRAGSRPSLRRGRPSRGRHCDGRLRRCLGPDQRKRRGEACGSPGGRCPRRALAERPSRRRAFQWDGDLCRLRCRSGRSTRASEHSTGSCRDDALDGERRDGPGGGPRAGSAARDGRRAAGARPDDRLAGRACHASGRARDAVDHAFPSQDRGHGPCRARATSIRSDDAPG